MQGRRKVWKSGEALSNVVSIIYPLADTIGLTGLCKMCPPPSPRLRQPCYVESKKWQDHTQKIWAFFYFNNRQIECQNNNGKITRITTCPLKLSDIASSLNEWMANRYLSRFFDCLAHPNLSATLATDQKWALILIGMSYKSKKNAHL